MKAQLIVKGLKTENSPVECLRPLKMTDPPSITVYRHNIRKRELKESTFETENLKHQSTAGADSVGDPRIDSIEI